MTLSVYLAARFSRAPELNRYVTELAEAGITVTSRWLRGGHEWEGTDDDALPHPVGARFAREDIEDIRAADVVVAFTEVPRSGPGRGGRHVEAGIAIGLTLAGISKPLIIVGHRENVFYCLPELIYCATWDEAFHLLTNTPVSLPYAWDLDEAVEALLDREAAP